MEWRQDPRFSEDVESVRGRVRSWRATRRPGSAMPEDLWGAAVVLARKHGLYRIARGLPVDYGALKMRVDRRGASDVATRQADFIELTAARFGVSSEPPVFEVEVTDPDGARMVVRLPGTAAVDVVGLVGAFRRRCA